MENLTPNSKSRIQNCKIEDATPSPIYGKCQSEVTC